MLIIFGQIQLMVSCKIIITIIITLCILLSAML